MSVEAPTRPGLAGDDDDGLEQEWRQWGASMDSKHDYVVDDIGRRSILAGRTAIAGLAEDFHTDRIVPRHIASSPVLRRIAQVGVGPDNFIG